MEEKKNQKANLKENIQNNKKTLIILGSTLLASIALLSISSGWGAETEPEEGSRHTIESSSHEEWERLSATGDPLRFPTTEEIHHKPSSDPEKQQPTTAKLPSERTLHPSPSFVTTSRDTLIWEGGIYRKVGEVPRPKSMNTRPDTLIIKGKRYIEIK